MDKVLVATRIDGKIHQILKEIGDREDRTVSYLLRKAVEQYVGSQGKAPAGRSRSDGQQER